MIQVETPDGGIAEFPDETPPDVMRNALRVKFGGGPAKNVANDIKKSSGLSKIATSALRNLPGAPGAAFQLAEQTGLVESEKKAIANAPASAGRLAKDIVQPVLHPVETATNVGNIGKGVLQKLGIMEGQDATPYADAVGKFLIDRYGSGAAIRKTLETDPVGLASDIATVFSGGGGLAARAPGAVGRLGEVASTVGKAVDPLSAVGAAAKGAGMAATVPLGLSTGVGPAAIQEAARAGAQGGEASRAFLGGFTGFIPETAMVADARAAVNQQKFERGELYRQGMTKVGGDKTVLDFADIDKAVNNTVKTFKGQSIDPATEKIQSAIRSTVEDWKQLDPAEFHTAEGLDALKQKIGSIRDATQYGTPERLAADKVYNATRKTISDQVPEYGKIMKGYEEASAQIKEIEQTLSTKPNANVDTAIRKLLSSLRDNVNTNYGRRRELVGLLARSGATHLLAKLAGKTLSSVAPRGLARLLTGGEGAGAAIATVLGHPAAALAAIPVLAASSPALVGLGAYGAGAASRLPLRRLGQASRLTGAATDQ